MIIHGWCYLRHVLMLQHISCQPSSYLEFAWGLRTVAPQLPGCCWRTMFLYEFISQGFVNYTNNCELYSSNFAFSSSNYELHAGNHALYTQVTTTYTHQLLWLTNKLHIVTHKLPEKVAWETSKTHTTQENAIRVSCIFKFGLQLESI